MNTWVTQLLHAISFKVQRSKSSSRLANDNETGKETAARVRLPLWRRPITIERVVVPINASAISRAYRQIKTSIRENSFIGIAKTTREMEYWGSWVVAVYYYIGRAEIIASFSVSASAVVVRGWGGSNLLDLVSVQRWTAASYLSLAPSTSSLPLAVHYTTLLRGRTRFITN